MFLLKIFNPIIFIWNFFKYMSHLEGQRFSGDDDPYNFDDNDTKYF